MQVNVLKKYASYKECVMDIQAGVRELAQDLNRLRGLCTSGEWAAGLVPSLAEAFAGVRDRLAMQFALEDAFLHSLQSERTGDSPLLAELADLSEDHPALYGRISRLADEAESHRYQTDASVDVSRLIREFSRFDSQLIAHEAREVAVLLAAYCDHLGVAEK